MIFFVCLIKLLPAQRRADGRFVPVTDFDTRENVAEALVLLPVETENNLFPVFENTAVLIENFARYQIRITLFFEVL